jgi:hypothetical protein
VPLDELGVGAVDFIKLDAEGSEYDVWRGGRRTFASATTVIMEYAPKILPDGTAMLEEVREAGFRIAALDPGGNIRARDISGIHREAAARGLVNLILRR